MPCPYTFKFPCWGDKCITLLLRGFTPLLSWELGTDLLVCCSSHGRAVHCRPMLVKEQFVTDWGRMYSGLVLHEGSGTYRSR